MRSDLERKKHDYINELFAEENATQSAIRNNIIALGEKQIQIEAFEGKILSLLIDITGSKKILEFGTMHGYSTAWLADAVGRDGLIITIERDEVNAQIAFQNLRNHSNIRIINKDAALIENELQKIAPFDLIFIDANKSSYKNYFDMADQLLKKGGLIIADNCMFDYLLEEDKGRLAKIIDEFNHYVASNKAYKSVILPTAGGFLCAFKL